MSRGAGIIEGVISDLFAQNPKRVEPTVDLCRVVYGLEKVEKKHRVAVLRALKSLSKKSMPFLTRRVALQERADECWFDRRVYPLTTSDVAPATTKGPPKR